MLLKLKISYNLDIFNQLSPYFITIRVDRIIKIMFVKIMINKNYDRNKNYVL